MKLGRRRLQGVSSSEIRLESRKVCHTVAYLTTLLPSNNTKDVKKLWSIYEKRVAKVLVARISSLH